MPSLTNINRLFALADLLRELPRKEFDMNMYARPVDDLNFHFDFVERVYCTIRKPAPSCGTACCIAGWAANVHPDLYLDNWWVVRHRKTYSSGYSAFAEAFDVGYLEVLDLTVHDAPHQTPKAAARAVERLATRLAKEAGYEVVEIEE